MSCTSGMTTDTMMRVGLRRKRRKSRSMMARMRCMSDAWLLINRRRLQGVAQLVAGVMHKNVIQRCALHRKRSDLDASLARSVHDFDGGTGAVVRREAEDIVHRLHV